MRPKRPKLASLAQKICTLWFQFFGAFFAPKPYPFKNIFDVVPFSILDILRLQPYFMSKAAQFIYIYPMKIAATCIGNNTLLAANCTVSNMIDP